MLDLQTSRGKVVGLGRLKIPRIPKLGFDCEIPLLSFLVIEREDNANRNYIATCIHMQMDGYGVAISDAINDMVSSVWEHLFYNFSRPEWKESAWENLFESFKSNPRSDILWDKYHALQLEFAKKGIVTDRHAELGQKIESLQKRVDKLESELKGREELVSTLINTLIGEKRSSDSGSISEVIVDFQPAERVA